MFQITQLVNSSQTPDLTGLSPESVQLTAVPYAFKYWFMTIVLFLIVDVMFFVIYISSLSSPLDLGPHVILPDFSS